MMTPAEKRQLWRLETQLGTADLALRRCCIGHVVSCIIFTIILLLEILRW